MHANTTKDMATRNWQKDIQPLIKKYKGKKFPLDYRNTYELVVMVILAARDSDANINKIAPDFFKAFPNMKALAKATEDTLYPLLRSVRSSKHKSSWLMSLAATQHNAAANPRERADIPEPHVVDRQPVHPLGAGLRDGTTCVPR